MVPLGHEQAYMKTKLEEITPEKAREYLKGNIHNRPIRQSTIEHYAREMKIGNWVTTHQGIAFDEDGSLLDGQHRLLAIIESGCTIPILVSTQIPKMLNHGSAVHTMDCVDRGLIRKVADQLHLNHGVANANLVVGVGNAIARMCHGSARGLTTPNMLVVLEIYGEVISRIVAIVMSFIPAKNSAIIAPIAFAAKIDQAKAEEFAEQLASGEGLKRGSPALLLRNSVSNRSVSSRPSKIATIESTANCLYNFFEGNQLTMLKSGRVGLEYFRSKQKNNIKKIVMALGLEQENVNAG